MYPNLRAEMARKNITQKKLAEMTNNTTGLICAKLNGKSEISFPLAWKIKNAIGTSMPLEQLFAEE